MAIQYAEITIIRNLEEESIFRGLGRLLGFENSTNENDTIIVHFEKDGTIYDTKEYVDTVDTKYEFGMIGYAHSFPIYFEITKNEHKTTLFYKRPIIVNNTKCLNFNHIFKGCKRYNANQLVNSCYNVIYDDCMKNIEQFAIARVVSNEEKPRYLLAYDASIFDKSDIVYLSASMLKLDFEIDIGM